MSHFNVALIIWAVLSCGILPFLADEFPENTRDYTVLTFIIILAFFPAVLFYTFFSSIMPFLKSKPFKKCRFKIGEKVTYRGKDATITRSEKEVEGDFVVITFGNDYDLIKVQTSEVRKVSKLETALK